MSIFKRIFGISETRPPGDQGCWTFSDGKVNVDLSRAPELQGQGGAIRLEGGGLPARVLLVHGTDGQYHAFLNKCTHFGRRLDPLPGQPQVRCCSVNKSTFDYDGGKVSGPAKGPVTRYDVETKENLLTVLLG
jgi:nitrite reductase/ring-hydroxylating ferredoxin subunit